VSEEVIRHRGGERDENGQWQAAGNVPLTAMLVAPGGGSEYTERGRDGETVAFVVYFRSGTDLTSADELSVRGQRFSIIVNDWRAGGRGGLEVLCTRGQG
jgi:hypothetical protein